MIAAHLTSSWCVHQPGDRCTLDDALPAVVQPDPLEGRTIALVLADGTRRYFRVDQVRRLPEPDFAPALTLHVTEL